MQEFMQSKRGNPWRLTDNRVLIPESLPRTPWVNSAMHVAPGNCCDDEINKHLFAKLVHSGHTYRLEPSLEPS